MPTTSASAWLLPTVAVLAGILGADAVWVVLAVATGKPCSWMALLAAADVVFMLRLTGVGAGRARTWAAVLGTALAVALAQWFIVATQLGMMLGLQPLDSAMRLGPSLARQLLLLSLDRVDFAWLLASLPVAALLAMRSRRERAATS